MNNTSVPILLPLDRACATYGTQSTNTLRIQNTIPRSAICNSHPLLLYSLGPCMFNSELSMVMKNPMNVPIPRDAIPQTISPIISLSGIMAIRRQSKTANIVGIRDKIIGCNGSTTKRCHKIGSSTKKPGSVSVAERKAPIRNSIVTSLLKMSLSASDKNTKIYSIEIDFDVLRRRRYN